VASPVDVHAELSYDEKLRRHRASLTLAQRMGLTSEPDKPLSAEQWEAVKRASDLREDSDTPCSICLDDFRQRPQVILSCSHVFHSECLRSFERFSGGRRCPLCRKACPDATVHSGGFMVWRRKCASRIQKAWRGHRERRRMFEQLKDPGFRAEAPALHRRYCGRALHAVGCRLEQACEEREDALDRFLESLDDNVAKCSEQLRDGLVGFEQLHGLEPSEPRPLETQSRAALAARADAPVQAQQTGVSAETWAQARRAALQRSEEEGGEIDCPICFQPCQLRGREAARTELLSCSHVFHRCCLVSFESFHVFEKHLCPVCRQSYERRPWQHSALPPAAPPLGAEGLPPKAPAPPRNGLAGGAGARDVGLPRSRSSSLSARLANPAVRAPRDSSPAPRAVGQPNWRLLHGHL